MPEFAAAEIRGRSFKILAQVELTEADAEGVIIANGARFGGHTLFIKDRKLWYVNNFLGHPARAEAVLARRADAGAHVLGMEFSKESHGEHGEAIGTATLYVDDLAVAKSDWKTQPGHFALCGEGLTVGRDGSDPVIEGVRRAVRLHRGRIRVVEINVSDDVYLDLERDFHAALVAGLRGAFSAGSRSACEPAEVSLVYSGSCEGVRAEASPCSGVGPGVPRVTVRSASSTVGLMTPAASTPANHCERRRASSVSPGSSASWSRTPLRSSWSRIARRASTIGMVTMSTAEQSRTTAAGDAASAAATTASIVTCALPV